MKIVSKKILAQASGVKIVQMEVTSKAIAEKVQPGQFVVLMVDEVGERIPLTVVDKDEDKGLINLIFQEAGFTTKLLGRLSAGDSLFALSGPLGHASEIKDYGRVLLVGGGVGLAELYPVAKALKKQGNHITTILGAKTKKLLILEEELKSLSDEFHVSTDDGSHGRKGFTSDMLEEILKDKKFDFVYCVGPIPMMKKVSKITGALNIKTVVSLNALMVDATGMCGCCRVTVSGVVKFSCVDGPEFDAHSVDWDELEKRNRIYSDKEKHICRINKL